MPYAFQQCKNFENLLRFDKVADSLKVQGNFFLSHSVEGLPFHVVEKYRR